MNVIKSNRKQLKFQILKDATVLKYIINILKYFTNIEIINLQMFFNFVTSNFEGFINVSYKKNLN